MPDPICIQSGSAGKHWPEEGRMILAHWLASGLDPFDQNLTQSDRTKSDPSRFSTVWSRLFVEECSRVWKAVVLEWLWSRLSKSYTGPYTAEDTRHLLSFLFFFSIAATLKVRSARWLWPSFQFLLTAVEFGVFIRTAVGHTFCLDFCRSGNLCSICSAVWSWRPQWQVADGASVIFLDMWALSRLWPVSSLMTTVCCHRSRKWKSSLSVRCPRAALMRVFLSWKLSFWVRWKSAWY